VCVSCRTTRVQIRIESNRASPCRHDLRMRGVIRVIRGKGKDKEEVASCVWRVSRADDEGVNDVYLRLVALEMDSTSSKRAISCRLLVVCIQSSSSRCRERGSHTTLFFLRRGQACELDGYLSTVLTSASLRLLKPFFRSVARARKPASWARRFSDCSLVRLSVEGCSRTAGTDLSPFSQLPQSVPG